jgi:4-aminobutyrate aminotransferase
VRFATVGITGNRGWGVSSLSPVQVTWALGGYRYRSQFRHLSDSEYVDACTADLRDLIDTTTAGDVACMIAEPIQGVGGFTVPPDGLYAAYAEVLAEHDILFVSDEVQTGWGRTGEHFWGYQAHGITPDALTFAKGIGNGTAIGGVVARRELMDCLNAQSVSTFGGNPLSTAAAKATLDYVLEHDLQQQALRVGTLLREGLEKATAQLQMVGDVRGKGADDRRRAGPARHHRAGHRRRGRRDGARPRGWAADRQGRPLRQLPARRLRPSP